MSALASPRSSTRPCQWHAGCDQPSSGRRNKDGLLLCSRHANTARQQRDYRRHRAREKERTERKTLLEHARQIIEAAFGTADTRSFGGHRIGRPTLEQSEHARRVDGILVRLLGGIPTAARKRQRAA